MELNSIESNIVRGEYSGNAESLHASRISTTTIKTKALYNETRENLKKVVSSQNPKNRDIEKLFDQFNKLADRLNIEMRFSISETGPNHIHVKMINRETNEVIREIPPERFAGEGSKMLDTVGLMIDEMA